MIVHAFHKTYDNMWHFTMESLLPLVDVLERIEPGDIVWIPDYPAYPVGLVRRMFPNNEVVVVPPVVPKKLIPNYLEAPESFLKVRTLCSKLLSYIAPQKTARPCVYLSFRLHNRVWLPLGNIQVLVNALRERYEVVLSLNPRWEKVLTNLAISNVIFAYDLPYEEQLGYALASDYSIHTLGAGMIFPQLVGLPAVVLSPCLCSETYPIGPSLHGYKNLVCLSDKKPVSAWNENIQTVTVEAVLEAFKTLESKPKENS